MGQLAILAAILALVGTLFLQTSSRTNINANATEAIAIAENMIVYRNAVSPYARDNPTVDGTVTDSALGLPMWYQRIGGVNNYVNAGTGYVYFSSNRPELTYQILKASHNAITTGIKQGGHLINPLNTTNYSTPITLPSAIPDGSVVYAF